MQKLGKLENPIVIKLSHLGNVILPFNGVDTELPLSPGALFAENTSHYGFMIILDYNNKQAEYTFRTDNEISGISMTKNVVYVFERGVDKHWQFDSNGNIITANYATIDFSISDKEYNVDGEIRKMSPETIKLVIEEQIEHNHVEFKDEKYPIGLVLAGEHYGLIIKNKQTGEEQQIPTEGTIYGVESDKDSFCGYKVYENGKYHPWKINGNGKIIEEAQFNPYSRRDQEYYYSKYGKKLTLK